MIGQHSTSDKNNWFTPLWVFKELLPSLTGSPVEIDLDWYTSEEANKTVGARKIFTKDHPLDLDELIEERGLTGWCNPPYMGSRYPMVAVEEILLLRAKSIIEECWLLINANMETKANQLALGWCDYAFLFNKRISFIDGDTMEVQRGNNKGQVLYYFGSRTLKPALKYGRLLKEVKHD